MEKYFKTITVCFACVSFFAACDTMDTKPFTSFSEELVWSTKETADAFVINTYNNSVTYFAQSGLAANYQARTPDGAQCSQVGEGIDGVATELGITNSTDFGFNRFAALRQCNLIIAKVKESETLTESQKTELDAEARFLRGLIFFDQARKMGRFVPITELLTTDDTEFFKTPATQTVAESYSYVMDDLMKAAQGMPEESLPGRANKYAAHLIRSRAALQAYAYTNNSSYLDMAIESANAVINSGKYKLTEKYGDMFDENSPEDAEIILGRYFLSQNTRVSTFTEMIRLIPNINPDDVKQSGGTPFKDPNGKTFEGWGTIFPTQDLVDQYLAIDEVTGEAVAWWESSQYKNNVTDLNRSNMTEGCVGKAMRGSEERNMPTATDLVTGRSDYELFTHYGEIKEGSDRTITDIMYSNRDKRLDYTVVRDQSTWMNEYCELNLTGNMSQGSRDKTDGGWYTTTTGYYFRKGVVTPYPRAYASSLIDYHFVVARLGEAYMNLAEAQLLKKNIPEAVAALNATRVTHGGLPASKASTEEEAWKDYIRERRVEMALEGGDIYFSYLRWGKYGGYANYGRSGGDIIVDLDRPVYKISISPDRKRFAVGQLTLLNSWNRNFTVRRYLFPIPQGQIDTRTAHGIVDNQNEGW